MNRLEIDPKTVAELAKKARQMVAEAKTEALMRIKEMNDSIREAHEGEELPDQATITIEELQQCTLADLEIIAKLMQPRLEACCCNGDKAAANQMAINLLQDCQGKP